MEGGLIASVATQMKTTQGGATDESGGNGLEGCQARCPQMKQRRAVPIISHCFYLRTSCIREVDVQDFKNSKKHIVLILYVVGFQ